MATKKKILYIVEAMGGGVFTYIVDRVSKIARYKPEQLNRLMKSKENWLLHEFIAQALDQFIDELAAEITKQDIMNAGQKE